MYFLMVLINLFICLIFWIVFFYFEKKCIELNDEIELKECFLSGLPFLSYVPTKVLKLSLLFAEKKSFKNVKNYQYCKQKYHESEDIKDAKDQSQHPTL